MTGVERRIKYFENQLSIIQNSNHTTFRNINVENIVEWQVLLVPDKEPYNKAAFKIQISFPDEYPFKPPKLIFLTKIYHPNIDERGQICLPIIKPENWRPATKTLQILESLMALINDPDPTHPHQHAATREYIKKKKKFMKNASDHAAKFGEKRPTD